MALFPGFSCMSGGDRWSPEPSTVVITCLITSLLYGVGILSPSENGNGTQILAFRRWLDTPIISWEYDDWCLGRVFPYVLQTRPQNNQWLLPVAQVETVDRCQLQGLQHNPGAKVQHFERPNRHNAISYGPALITSFCPCGQIWRSCVFCFIYEKSEVWNLSLLSSAIFGQMIIHHL